MQPALKQRVEAMARANNRSLNAEIVSRLEATLAVAESELAKDGWISKVKSASGAERIEALEGRLTSLEVMVAALRGFDEK